MNHFLFCNRFSCIFNLQPFLVHVLFLTKKHFTDNYNRYVNLKACISRLPENGYGVNVSMWPARLLNPPARLQSIQFDAYISRKELFKAEYKYWDDIIDGYIRALHWKKMRLRNILDMRAGFGGFESLTHSHIYLS